MKKILSAASFLLLSFIPASASAQTLSSSTCTLHSYSDIVKCAVSILNSLVPIIIALIFVWVLWSAFNFAKQDGEKRSEYRSSMVWGLVALFVAVSIYGLVAILSGTFGLSSDTQIQAPNVTTQITQHS